MKHFWYSGPEAAIPWYIPALSLFAANSALGPPPPPTMLWLRPEQLAFARRVVAAANLDVVSIGTPAKGRSDALASEFGVGGQTDLRAAVAACDVPLLLMLDTGDFGATANDEDARAILAAAARGVKIASLVPLPASVQILSRQAWLGERAMVDAGACDRVHLLATPRSLTRVRDAISAIEQDDLPRHVSLRVWGRAGEHNLANLLVGGLDLVTHVLGSPESVDCVYTSAQMTSGLHALPGESLHNTSESLHGDCACVLRFTSGAAASLDISSAAGGFGLEFTMLGEFGRISVRHDGLGSELLWLGAQGEAVEIPVKARDASTPEGREHAGSLAGLIADELTSLLHDESRGLPRVEMAEVLPLAQAALLSARTGQGESPELFARILE